MLKPHIYTHLNEKKKKIKQKLKKIYIYSSATVQPEHTCTCYTLFFRALPEYSSQGVITG